MPLPAREINFEDWRNVILKNFPDLLFPAEMGLSIVAQLLIKEITNPFSLVLVDVPSAGKTIAINFFSDVEELAYATDKFTPASFVSNAANVKKKDLAKVDLLPRLRYKLFLIRDLATLFSKRDDDLNECLGILTRILDGEGLNTESGIHGQRKYVGEYLFMILAGSTPIPPRVWRMMGNLGSRLFFLGLNSKDKSEEELVGQITNITHKIKEAECRIVTKSFLYTLWNKYPDGVDWDKDQDPHEVKLVIARCAKLLAKLRGVINIWKERGDDGVEYSYNSPVIEKPDRINQLFYNLCRGHALATGRTQINSQDLQSVIELAIDSAPTTRSRLFRKLLENGGSMTTSQVEADLQCSKPTALKEMETLRILGICQLVDDPQNSLRDSFGKVFWQGKIMILSDKLKWFLSDECKLIRGIPIPPKPPEQDNLL